MGSTKDGVKWVKDKLRALFKLTDLGIMSYFLGVVIKLKENTMFYRNLSTALQTLTRAFRDGHGKIGIDSDG